MREIKLFVATPCTGEVTMQYCQSVLDLQKKSIEKNIHISFLLMQSPLVTQARNLLVSEFLNSQENFDYLLFLDSDIKFNFNTIFNMIKKNKDVIACPYPIKLLDWNKTFQKLNSQIINGENHLKQLGLNFPIKYKNNNIKNDLLEVTHISTGCMLIKRKVIEKMIKSYPELVINEPIFYGGKQVLKQNYYNFFDCYHDLKTKAFYGEDYAFCKKWIDIGGKVYAYVKDNIGHVGQYEYNGNLLDELENNNFTWSNNK